MTEEAVKETIAITVPAEVMEFVRRMVKERRFADVSHAFEFMAREFIRREKEREVPAVQRLERLAKEGAKKSADLVAESVEIVQDISITDALKKPAEIVKKTVGAKVLSMGTAADENEYERSGKKGQKAPRKIRVEEG